jgi:uncharacterized protein (TIGR03437 family)
MRNLPILAFCALTAWAQSVQIKSISAGPDQTLTYPSGPASPPYLVDLPDEHTTVIPPATPSSPYLVFAASKLSGGTGGAVVLQTSDLKNFEFATASGYNRQVFAPPLPIDQCDTTHITEFDGNYAAPGSVVQDPTLPPGNLIIIYEAENHCPGGVYNPEFYATIGFARSTDNGRTWPAPINSPTGGPSRHPVLQNSIPQPTSAHGPLGDAIPSAFVDKSASGDYYLYIVYGGHTGSNTPNQLSIARAKLGADAPTFLKWNNGAFSEAGIGGADIGFLPSDGCQGSQVMGEISRNDDLGLYLALFVCVSGPSTARVGAWYYSVATSLDLQDWSTPRLVDNSQFPVTSSCSSDGRGQQFDGWYPSSMSPGAPAGHTKLTGLIFYHNGCDTGKRVMSSRAFTITATAAPVISQVANAEGESLTIAPNTWVEVKGANLAPAGDTRIWQGTDFANGKMPTQLDGVSVTVNGKSAYIYYISPTQINILTPPDAIQGAVQVVATNNGTASNPFLAQGQPLSPSLFIFNGGPYVAAVHADGGLIGPASLYPGSTTPVNPGETILLFANGFGPTTIPVVSGSTTQGGTIVPPPVIKIGGLSATVQFAGLVGPGEFQFNVVVPAGIGGGDQPISATYNSLTTQAGTLLTIAGVPSPTSVTYYVSPTGNDSWSGTLPAPNAANSDGPLATFDRARAVVQALNKTGLKQVTVQFRGGTYYLRSTVGFTAADSGTASLPIVYQNYPGEAPVFSGGTRVVNWTNTGRNTWKTTLPASTQYFENLFYNGARRLRPRLGGYLGAYYRYASTVYLNAAGPPAKAPDPNCSVYIAGSGWECFDRFQYDPKDPIATTWKNLAPAAGNACNQPAGNSALAGDIEMLTWQQFSSSKLRVSCIDAVAHVVYFAGPTGINQTRPQFGGFVTGNRYLVENVQDALSQPGQFFIDHSTTPWTLTYLANPGENPNSDMLIIPQIPHLLIASGLQYVVFQGLTFEHDNYVVPASGHKSSEMEPDISAAVSFQNAQHITFDSNVVTEISGTALNFVSCVSKASSNDCASIDATGTTANNVIQNSAFYDIGALGVLIGNPYTNNDTDSNVPQFNLVQNNVVEGYGRTIPASFGIAQGSGHDNTFTHNDVYDGYHTAVSISEAGGDTTRPNGVGNANNIISFNHVYNLFQGIMNDGGAIRIEAGNSVYTAPGNKILNNKIHDVTDASIIDSNGYGGNGIYLDNQTGLVDIENNLVYRVSANPMFTPQGPASPNEASTVKNNIFAYGRGGIVAINDPYTNGVPTVIPLVWNFTNNLVYFDRASTSTPKFFVEGGCIYAGSAPFTQFQLFRSNLYWRTDGGFASDPKAFAVQSKPDNTGKSPCTPNTSDWTFYTFAQWQQQVTEDLQSVVQNPGFANPSYPADDYSLPKGSPGVGFVPFDPSQAGRTNPLIKPPSVPATFPTKQYNPATDY